MKSLAYWTSVLARAEVAKKHAASNTDVHCVYEKAPRRWFKKFSTVGWRGTHAMNYRGQRKRWLRHLRLARLARREYASACRRVEYAKERIAALENLTAWDRVLRGSVV